MSNDMMEMKGDMKMKKVNFVDMYTKENCTEILPNESRTAFLRKRNNNYMNYTALSFENRKITYEELHERIDQYAKALYQLGVRSEEKVAINVMNTPESVFLLYALDKVGCTVIGLSPLNNEYKMKRDLELTKPNRIISIDIIYDKAKDAAQKLNISPILFPIDSKDSKDALSLLNAEGSENSLLQIINESGNCDTQVHYYNPENTTDILFTGGSTGVHKGVELIGNGLNCVVQALDHVFHLEAGMVHLGNVPFGHMAFGRLVLHYALANNLNYALTLKMSPQEFLAELIRTGAHGATGGPIHWESLIHHPLLKEGCLANLKQATSGGEYFKPQKRQLANEAIHYAGSQTSIGDGLGLTEMWAMTHICLSGKNTPNTVGYTVPYVEAKIVDDDYNEVKSGEYGNLMVKGPGMMKGYFNNSSETRKVFWYDKNGAKWYNTGDIARKTGINNEEYEYVGRKKRNFVCGVDNIYPEQIEELLLKIPNVREAVITKVPDDKVQYLPKYHISVYDMNFNQEELEKKINETIESTIGKSAKPGYIEYTDKPLPRTDNGKLDVTLLEEQDKR